MLILMRRPNPKNEYASTAGELVHEIVRHARSQGSSQKKLAAQAGLSEASLSRMKSLEDVRLSSLIKLAEAAGLRLTLVPDDDLAEQIIRGDLL